MFSPDIPVRFLTKITNNTSEYLTGLNNIQKGTEYTRKILLHSTRARLVRYLCSISPNYSPFRQNIHLLFLSRQNDIILD